MDVHKTYLGKYARQGLCPFRVGSNMFFRVVTKSLHDGSILRVDRVIDGEERRLLKKEKATRGQPGNKARYSLLPVFHMNEYIACVNNVKALFWKAVLTYVVSHDSD